MLKIKTGILSFIKKKITTDRIRLLKIWRSPSEIETKTSQAGHLNKMFCGTRQIRRAKSQEKPIVLWEPITISSARAEVK